MSFRNRKSAIWGDSISSNFPRRCVTRKFFCIQFFLCLALLGWFVWNWNVSTPLPNPTDFLPELRQLEKALDEHNRMETRLRNVLLAQNMLPARKPPSGVQLPVLVIACNRIGVNRTLAALLKHRNATLSNPDLKSASFPITVSHGCQHKPTGDVLASYGDSISVIRFQDVSANQKSNLTKYQLPYRAVAHHYKFALDHMFLTLNHSSLIIVEDDLDIAPDFFDYFVATLPLLQSDPTLFCVSAWNDNGRSELINLKRNDLIYRSDFFSGLGWMLLRDFWLEIRDQWPDAFWDEYLRKPAVRKQRACLRPEIGRTVTFGRLGISRGQFYDKYMKWLVLNSARYPFLQADLSYLRADQYVATWQQKVYNDSVPISIDELLAGRLPPAELVPSLRVTYTTNDEFVRIADHFKLMSDIKSGVMRNAFRGVVPIWWERRSVYVAPPDGWKSYTGS